MIWLWLSCTQAPPAELQGLDRDRSLHEAIRASGAEQVDQVLEQAADIEDPIVRGAAITEYVQAHNNGIPRDKGMALCDLLEQGQDRGFCRRRLDAAHLRR